MNPNTSVQLDIELALKALIPYLQTLGDPNGLADFLDDAFPDGFLFMAGHEATTLPDDKTSYLAFIAGLPDYRLLAMRYPVVSVRMELGTAGIADEQTREAAIAEHSVRVAALIRLFSQWYYEPLRQVFNTGGFILNFGPSDVNPSQNRFQLSNHGLLDGDEIRFLLGSVTNALPTPLVDNQFYFVVNASANMFQFTATEGGNPVIIEDSGYGTNQIVKRETRPWAGLGFDAWTALPPLEGESPTGKHFVASSSYQFTVHFEVEPDLPES